MESLPTMVSMLKKSSVPKDETFRMQKSSNEPRFNSPKYIPSFVNLTLEFGQSNKEVYVMGFSNDSGLSSIRVFTFSNEFTIL